VVRDERRRVELARGDQLEDGIDVRDHVRMFSDLIHARPMWTSTRSA
jgi:hypothetical protein